jgi:hypothetical protein
LVLALRWITATCFSSLFLAVLAAWQLSEGSNVFHEPVGSGVAIRALPDLCGGIGFEHPGGLGIDDQLAHRQLRWPRALEDRADFRHPAFSD